MDLQAGLQMLVQKGLGCKQTNVVYAITKHPMDGLIHCVRNNISTVAIPMNTACVPRGAYSILLDLIPEVKNIQPIDPQTALGTVSSVFVEMQVKENQFKDLKLSGIFIQSTFGARKPAGDHHVDLEALRFSLMDLADVSAGDLAIYYHGNEAEYTTPWHKIESVLTDVMDATDKKITVFIPAFAQEHFTESFRVPSYTYKKKSL